MCGKRNYNFSMKHGFIFHNAWLIESAMNLPNITGSSPHFYTDITRIHQMPEEMRKGNIPFRENKMRKRAEKYMIYFRSGEYFLALRN